MQPVYILIAILVVWNLILTYLYFSSSAFYSKLKKEEGADLKQVLNSILERSRLTDSRLSLVEKTAEAINASSLKNISGFGLIRYNPFVDAGSNQSFSLALLDNERNGLVITSLHGRNGTRVYSKPVKLGDKDQFELSEEEKQAIDIAKKRLI